jgi:hypothetical protein
MIIDLLSLILVVIVYVSVIRQILNDVSPIIKRKIYMQMVPFRLKLFRLRCNNWINYLKVCIRNIVNKIGE